MLKKIIVYQIIIITVIFARIPDDFVYIHNVIPDAVMDIRYCSSNNFLARPVDGYEAPVAILHRDAAAALKNVQEELAPFGLGIKVFDAYRPQSAVDHFVRWAKDLADTTMKARLYPNVHKKDLFKKGYIASKSGHSRGSTLDLTIIDLQIGQELDMGSPFDYFGKLSHPRNPSLPTQIRANRMLLQRLMIKHGFRYLPEEWWHFTYNAEAYKDEYFNFPVK